MGHSQVFAAPIPQYSFHIMADDYRIPLRGLAKQPVSENEQEDELFFQIVFFRQRKKVGEYC